MAKEVIEKKKVVAVVGARLNSSRLPGKQLLDLAGKPLIGRLFDRLEYVPEIDHIVLATTADDYNKPLVEWAVEHRRDVYPYDGDVNDLVGRVDAVVRQEQADILVYVCGDSPLVEPTTLSRLLTGILRHGDMERVALSPLAEGRKYIHEGFDIYGINYWREIVARSIEPEEREHVGAAAKKIEGKTEVLIVEGEPQIFSDLNHRISVDTPSDYQFMKTVYEQWYQQNPQDSLVSLPWVIEQLVQNSSLRGINEEVQQKRVGERIISVLLVTEAGDRIGLGHLRRSVVVARALQDQAKAKVHLLVVGKEASFEWLELISHQWIAERAQMLEYFNDVSSQYSVVVIDMKEDKESLLIVEQLLQINRAEGRKSIAIDGFVSQQQFLDLVWIPSFYLSRQLKEKLTDDKSMVGWDQYLLTSMHEYYSVINSSGNSLLVMLGGSDMDGIGEKLPSLLQKALPNGGTVHWVQGPYANGPKVEQLGGISWEIHTNPANVLSLFQKCSVALVSYGVSLFELLAFGMPTVVMPSSAGPDEEEWEQFDQEGVALTALGLEDAVRQTAGLLENKRLRESLNKRARSRIDGKGATRFAERVICL